MDFIGENRTQCTILTNFPAFDIAVPVEHMLHPEVIEGTVVKASSS